MLSPTASVSVFLIHSLVSCQGTLFSTPCYLFYVSCLSPPLSHPATLLPRQPTPALRWMLHWFHQPRYAVCSPRPLERTAEATQGTVPVAATAVRVTNLCVCVCVTRAWCRMVPPESVTVTKYGHWCVCRWIPGAWQWSGTLNLATAAGVGVKR